MTHEDEGHYTAKHPIGTELSKQIAEAVKRKVVNGRITCSAAHAIANELNFSPADVGMAIDLLEVRINKCQLGLYGYSPQKRIVKPAKEVSQQLEEVIKTSLVNNRMPCLSCWEIAKKFGIAKMKISEACELLKIKISPCQLGAFR